MELKKNEMNLLFGLLKNFVYIFFFLSLIFVFKFFFICIFGYLIELIILFFYVGKY